MLRRTAREACTRAGAWPPAKAVLTTKQRSKMGPPSRVRIRRLPALDDPSLALLTPQRFSAAARMGTARFCSITEPTSRVRVGVPLLKAEKSEGRDENLRCPLDAREEIRRARRFSQGS